MEPFHPVVALTSHYTSLVWMLKYSLAISRQFVPDGAKKLARRLSIHGNCPTYNGHGLFMASIMTPHYYIV